MPDMLDRFDGYPDPGRPFKPPSIDPLYEGPDVMDAAKQAMEEKYEDDG
jgi:hypothetical protein